MTGTLPPRIDVDEQNVAHSATDTARASRESIRTVASVRPWAALICGVSSDRTLLIADWLLLACREAGLVAQAIPVADAVMSNAMYIEVAASPEIEESFSDAPWGAVDLVVAGEHLELVRAIDAGYVDSSITTVVSSVRRSFSKVEHVVAPEHVASESEIDALARAHAAMYVGFDAPEVARWYELPTAVQPGLLFGAIHGTGVIGLDEANCIAAIRSLGIDPALQAEGFRRGIRFGRRAGGRVRRAKTPYQFTRRRRALVDHRSRRTFEQLVERVDTFLPPQHVTVAQEAIFMLCEFQDAEWATRLVDELEAVARAEQQLLGSAAIAGEDSIVGDVVRGLATLLVWPDPAWIAQRKLHPARLKALRAANSLTRHDQYELIDSLVLDESERRSLRSPRMRMGSEPVRPSILQDIRVERIVTTSPRGAAQLRRMAAAKKHRRIDARTSRELDTLQSWLEALHDALRIDHELARIVARSALIVQGQGAVRDAHRVSAEAFWGRVVRQSIAIDRAAAGSIPTVSARVIPFVWEQMCTSGALALWEFAAPMLAITMSHARGMPLAQTLEHIEQMCTAQAARVS